MKKTVNILISEIKIKQSSSSTFVFIFLEGISDIIILKHFFDKEKVKLIDCNGKENIDILSSTMSVELQGFKHFLIRDADFNRILKINSTYINLFLTDFHDIDVMILNSLSFNKVIESFGSKTKIDNLRELEGENIVKYFCKILMPYSYMKYYSVSKNIEISFKEIKIEKFIDHNNLDLDVEKMKNIILMHKDNKNKINKEELDRICNNKNYDNLDLFQLTNGHDLIKLVTIAFKKVIGTYSSNDLKYDLLEKAIYCSYEFSSFKITKLFSSIKSWESDNSEKIFSKFHSA